ncbi:VTT domain-containing protein [Desulfosarcina sp.]|uniref:VTT domain-containing protein n=1 Tax=Desulfosarcina sp. TaxID=2027861 RepID=UPI0039709B43
MKKIFEPSKNCHQLATAHRAAFIIDGEAYFRALHESFLNAQHTIFVVGWDLHSDLNLIREETGSDCPSGLGQLIDRLVAEKKALHVYLLGWDFAMIYTLEREFFPRYKLKWRTRKRIHFCLDGHHPVGASQHQKIVVVDDAVAFVGGFDLSQWRWDTPAHRPDDDRRVDPDGKPYPPFHDIQMAVDGPAARVLGRLARARWVRATGKNPIDPEDPGKDAPWPASVDPDFEQVEVAVARTLPAYGDRQAVREVERLYLDSIAAARRTIYIENQYLSSHRIGEALKQRLEEADGPEVVIVLPQKTGGWLEQHTMDILRGRILRNLRESDRHDRLRTYYPRITQEPECTLMVHAKVMVIDDDFVRVGSSNLSNRSMGFDSECDLAVATDTDQDVRSAIVRLRNRLIAEHSGCDIDDVANAVEKTGSLIEAIESLPTGDRALVALSGEVPSEVDQWVPESELLDPEKPVEPDELFDYFIRPEQQPFAYRHLMKVIFLIAGVLALAAVWRWTPASEWVDIQSAQAAGEWIRRQPLTPLLVIAAYIFGGMIAFPVTLMIMATVMVFGPWWGLAYALTGSELSALVVFGSGRLLGRDVVRRFAGSLLNRLSQKLSDSGLTAIVTFRIVPVAPFSVINLIAGVSEIRLKDFAIGTFVGMLPGVAAIALLADRISDSFRHPDWGRFIALGVAVLLVGGGLMGLRRWVKRKRADQPSQKSDSDDLQEPG